MTQHTDAQGDDELRGKVVDFFKNHRAAFTYTSISNLMSIIQAELSTQREQARQEVLDELLNELPGEAVDVSDSHSLGYDTAIREARNIINAKRKEDKKGD